MESILPLLDKNNLEKHFKITVCLQIHRHTRRGEGEAAASQNHLNLEKLGKSLSNYTKIRAIFAEISGDEKFELVSLVIFAEISDKSGNLSSWIG